MCERGAGGYNTARARRGILAGCARGHRTRPYHPNTTHSDPMPRALRCLSLAAFLLVSACDSGEPKGPGSPDVSPVAPTVVGASYVNKTLHRDHLDADALAALPPAREGDSYVQAFDLTLDFADGVDPGSIQRLRIFGQFSRRSGSGPVGVGWEWTAAELAPFVSGGALVFPNLLLPDEIEGDAVVEVRAEADTVATYDFLHHGVFAYPLSAYDLSWYDLTTLEAEFYVEDDRAATQEAVWLAQDGTAELGRTGFELGEAGGFSQRTLLPGAPSTAEQVYFATSGTIEGVPVETRAAMLDLPARLPALTQFLDLEGGALLGSIPTSSGLIVQSQVGRTERTQASLIDPVAGTVAGPVALQNERVALAPSADGRSAWAAYESGAVERIDFDAGTSSVLLTLDGEAIDVVDVGRSLLVSGCIRNAPSGYCNNALITVDKASGAFTSTSVDYYGEAPVLEYNPAIRRLYLRDSYYSYVSAFQLNADDEPINTSQEPVPISPLAQGQRWTLSADAGEWITSTGTALRSENGPGDLDVLGRYLLGDVNVQPPSGYFVTAPGRGEVAALHLTDSYPYRSVLLSVFDNSDRSRTAQLEFAGDRPLGLFRGSGRYLAIVGSGSRAYVLPVMDGEVDPARHTPLTLIPPTL